MVLTCSHILAVHDADYRQSQKDFNSFVDSLTEKIIEKDPTQRPCKGGAWFLTKDEQLKADLLSKDLSNIPGHKIQSRSNSV